MQLGNFHDKQEKECDFLSFPTEYLIKGKQENILFQVTGKTEVSIFL